MSRLSASTAFLTEEEQIRLSKAKLELELSSVRVDRSSLHTAELHETSSKYACARLSFLRNAVNAESRALFHEFSHWLALLLVIAAVILCLCDWRVVNGRMAATGPWRAKVDCRGFVHKWMNQKPSEALLTAVPLWMAPNLLTICGLLLFSVAYAISVLVAPNFTVQKPQCVEDKVRFALACVGCVVFMYAGILADELDGKQARRRERSSRLGGVLDHGIDILSCAMCLQLMVAMVWQMGNGWEAANGRAQQKRLSDDSAARNCRTRCVSLSPPRASEKHWVSVRGSRASCTLLSAEQSAATRMRQWSSYRLCFWFYTANWICWFSQAAESLFVGAPVDHSTAIVTLLFLSALLLSALCYCLPQSAKQPVVAWLHSNKTSTRFLADDVFANSRLLRGVNAPKLLVAAGFCVTVLYCVCGTLFVIFGEANAMTAAKVYAVAREFLSFAAIILGLFVVCTKSWNGAVPHCVSHPYKCAWLCALLAFEPVFNVMTARMASSGQAFDDVKPKSVTFAGACVLLLCAALSVRSCSKFVGRRLDAGKPLLIDLLLFVAMLSATLTALGTMRDLTADDKAKVYWFRLPQ